VSTNAIGHCARPFIHISGLSEKEMPSQHTPNGVLIVDVPTLSCGVPDRIPGVPDHGYLVFTRSDGTKSVNVNQFRYYIQHVLEPFIDAERSGYGLPPNMPAVSWCDGASEQIQALRDE
jgi:hypothetical protein